MWPFARQGHLYHNIPARGASPSIFRAKFIIIFPPKGIHLSFIGFAIIHYDFPAKKGLFKNLGLEICMINSFVAQYIRIITARGGRTRPPSHSINLILYWILPSSPPPPSHPDLKDEVKKKIWTRFPVQLAATIKEGLISKCITSK